MTQWLEVNDWLDLAANAWIGIVLIAVAAVPSWLAARNHKTIRDIKDQVVNGHAGAPPLRADLDKAIAAIEALARDISGLRSELVLEETRRRAQISELAEDVDRMRRR